MNIEKYNFTEEERNEFLVSEILEVDRDILSHIRKEIALERLTAKLPITTISKEFIVYAT